MEHRGIKYEIRARGYPQKWEWAVYPNGVSQRRHWSGEVVGGRHRAIDAARLFIDQWLEQRDQRARQAES